MGMSLGQIAAATGLPRPTVQRIVDALLVEHFLAPDEAHGGVRLGGALMRLAGSAYTDVKAIAQPHMRALCQRLQETILFTSLTHGRITYIDQVLPDRSLQTVINPAQAIDPFFTATGKAHLATLSAAELERWLPERLIPPTPKAVQTVPELLQQLEEVRRTGVAVDAEERTEGAAGLSVTLEDADRITYAVSLITTMPRYLARAEEFGRELAATRDAIRQSLDEA